MRTALASMLLALASLPLHAHDLWLEPTTFAPVPGQAVGLRVQVGQSLVGEPLPLIPQLVKRFVVRDARGERPVAARPGADPAGLWRADTPGLNIVSYQSRPSRIELDADKFTAYLLEEGLEAIVALRAQRGQSGAPASERYARCAKGLLQVGPASHAQHDVDLGCALELVAERNPFVDHAVDDAMENHELPFRLSFLGQPLPGALVVAINARHPADKLSQRTDAQGRVRFALTPGGLWLVKVVHMVPAGAGVDAQWQSWWASTTFER